MPIYEYRRPDGSTFELQQSFSDDTLTVDPETGVPVERVLHAPAVHFKGKGFYNTDYGTRKRQRENAASSDVVLLLWLLGGVFFERGILLGLLLRGRLVRQGRLRRQEREQKERVEPASRRRKPDDEAGRGREVRLSRP